MRLKNFLFLFFVFIAGCATPAARLSNIQQVADNLAIGKLYVGPFLDMRKGGNADTTILGTKRGGYGNPLGRVRHERGADEFVREHVINSARASLICADRKPDNLVVQRQNNKWVIEADKTPQNNRPILVGVINQLLVETGYSRGTLLDIDLELIDSKNGETLWSSKLLGNDSGGMGGGIFEDVDKLKNWLAKTLQDAALNKFASQEFQDMVKISSE